MLICLIFLSALMSLLCRKGVAVAMADVLGVDTEVGVPYLKGEFRISDPAM